MSVAWANPVEHAMVLIDTWGSVEAACDAAIINCDNATTERDSKYWFQVAATLVPSKLTA